MQGIITGIKPNQSVDIEIADNDQEILIFQREVLEQNPEIKKIRQILHDAVAEDPVNLELKSSIYLCSSGKQRSFSVTLGFSIILLKCVKLLTYAHCCKT